jgi:hypothetical protein
MDRLGDLEAFLAIVERGSQTAAARQLRRSLQSINGPCLPLSATSGLNWYGARHENPARPWPVAPSTIGSNLRFRRSRLPGWMPPTGAPNRRG